MKPREIKYLLIEQLPSFLSAFRNGIGEAKAPISHFNFNGHIIHTMEQSENAIAALLKNQNLHLVCINQNFPLSPTTGFDCSIAFLKYIKANYPNIKIIITIQNATVFNVRKLGVRIDPDSIIEVTDASQETIIKAFVETIEVGIYFSKTILQLQRIYRTNLHIVDDIDYHILHELSLGTKNIDLPKKIFLSSTTINRRKHKLKDFLGITDQSDSALIRKAKELRYV